MLHQSDFGIDDAELRRNPYWTLAVWGLRFVGGGLFVVLCGLVTLLGSNSAGLVVLAIGIVIYLISIAITYGGLIAAFRSFESPRPSLWKLRWNLIHDALHSK